MEPFPILTSKAVPLMLDNIDTDVITSIGRVLRGGSELIRFAFESLRYDAAGRPDPACPLNDPRYAGAQVLLAGANFGCGSSRETAARAVRGLGFRCVIAVGFGDIFRTNCYRIGVLPVALPATQVAALARFAAEGPGTLTVDLPALCVRAGAHSYRFDVPAQRRHALLDGLDELGLILEHAAAIARFETADRRARPWVYAGIGMT